MQVIQLYGLSILMPEQSTVLSILTKKSASDLCFDTRVDLDRLLERLLSELRLMSQDHFAQWIFDKNHTQIKVEQSIYCQKTKKSHRIDRLFFDVKTKQRWLIDFKSDKPNHDGSIPNSHQAQLNRYLVLLKELYPNETVSSALYYPLCQTFIVHCPEHSPAEISPA
jgi:ATP-dependent exoDNAse (exonuclease V) beta subunit